MIISVKLMMFKIGLNGLLSLFYNSSTNSCGNNTGIFNNE